MNELIELINKVNIIDIRSKEQYIDGHIPTAINLDPYELCNNPSKYLDLYKRYYIYCSNGSGSLKLCQLLIKKGYEVINVSGGFDSYLRWNFK